MRRMLLAATAIVFGTTVFALAQAPSDIASSVLHQVNADAKDKAAAKTADDKSATDKAAADKTKALEELLVKALQNSPDVQVAEARLKEAEAALRQARLLVAQKTVDLQQTMNQKQAALSLIENRYKMAAKARSGGMMSNSEVTKIEEELAAQKAQIAQVEAQVNMLVGKFPVATEGPVHADAALTLFARARQASPLVGTVSLDGGMGGGDLVPKRQPQSAMSDRLRKLLNTNFKVPEKIDQVSLLEMIESVRTATGAPILTHDIGDFVVKIDFKGEVTLAAFFQMLCDTVPSLSICVRDYGFFVTTDAPPVDAILFMDFLKSGEKSTR